MSRFRPRRAQLSVLLILVVALALPEAVEAQLFGTSKPITIEVISPKLGLLNPFLPSRFLPQETTGGWPLTVRLTSNGELGVGTRSTPPPPFPVYGGTGFLIFTDPDGCPSFSLTILTPGPCFGAPVDETFFEFTNDVDQAGVPDDAGNDSRRIALTDSLGGGPPSMLAFEPTTGTNTRLQTYGPRTSGPNSTDTLVQKCVGRFGMTSSDCTSDADCPAGPADLTCQTVPLEFDGVGWGADDDAPGVVMLANTGPGVVLDPSFNFPTPRQARNLAGFLTSVAWELNDSTKHSNVVLHMNVPNGLFQPVVQFDNCVGEMISSSACTGGELFRVDGGPPVTSIANLGDRVTTLRIFVVNGTAPSILADLDGNGIVDSKDALLAGYTLISRETTLRFRTLPQDEIPGILVDLDGNHLMLSPVLPAGGGKITQIPH